MTNEEKVKGPASYFPSIEKKYGKPIDEWKQIVRSSPHSRHMEIVNWLKAEYGMGTATPTRWSPIPSPKTPPAEAPFIANSWFGPAR